MIDFKISEFFGILGVGLFIVISIVYFYFLFYRLFNVRKHNKDVFIFWLKTTLKENYKETGYSVVTALLVYSTGLLCQDLTDHMTDSERNFNPVISFVKSADILDTEGELRKKTLVENEDKLTGLGMEVFDKARLILDTALSKRDIPFFNDGQPINNYWKQNGAMILQNDSLRRKFTGFVNAIYYTSKNWCYLTAPPIRAELESIQEHIDFARSVCIIAFLAMLLLLVFYFGYYLWEFLKPEDKRFKIITEKDNKRRVLKKVFAPLRALVILLVIFWVGQICYSAAEKNFNERAMGYYVSHFRFHDNSVGKK